MKSVVAALRHVVEVLNADNFRYRLRVGQLPRRDSAQPDMLNEALLLQLGERGERFFKLIDQVRYIITLQLASRTAAALGETPLPCGASN